MGTMHDGGSTTSIRIEDPEQPDAGGGDAADPDQLEIFIVGDSVEHAEVGLAEVPKLVPKVKRRGFVWLHLVDPEEHTVNAARETLKIHPTAAADVVSGRQQPKVQKFAEHLFILLWSVLRDEHSDDLVLGQTYVYIGDGWLLTVQRGQGGNVTDLPALLSETPQSMRSAAMPAAYTIMAEVVDGYAKAAADAEIHLQELEEQVFDDRAQEDHRRIYRVRKDIGRIDRAVSSIAAALRESTGHLDSFTVGTEQIVPYLHDLLDDAAGTAALINDQSRALDAVLSSHENNVAARQNKDMRTISSFAALLALPTLIAGLYGMNFQNIPLVQWEYGWMAIGAVLVVVDVIIYTMFKRRGWL
jgi:magnesium transporter